MATGAATSESTQALSCDLCGAQVSLRVAGWGDEREPNMGTERDSPEAASPPRCLSCRLALTMWECGGDGDLPRA